MTINSEKIKSQIEILLNDPISLNELFKATLIMNDIALFKKVFNQEYIKSKVTITLREAFSIAISLIQQHKDGTQYDYITALKYLYQHFPDLYQTSDENGISLLSESSTYGKNKIVELLLKEYNHDINAQDIDGHTALHKAIMYNQNNVVSTLLQNPKIQLNKASLVGFTPLATSIAYKNIYAENMIKSLVSIKNYHFTFKTYKGDKKFNIVEFKKMVTSGEIEFTAMPELPTNSEFNITADLNYFRQSIFFYFKTLFSDAKSINTNAKNSVTWAIKYLKLQAKHSDTETTDKALQLLDLITNLIGLHIFSNEEALKIFENLKHFNLHLPAELYLNISYHYLHIKSFKEAEELATIAATKTSSSSILDAAYYNLYYAQYNQGKISEAEISLRKAQLHNPEDLDIKLGLIGIDITNGRYAEAFGSIELLSSPDIKPIIIELYTKLAMHLITAGTEHNLAFTALQKAIELDPENTLLESYNKLFNIIQSNIVKRSELIAETLSEVVPKEEPDSQTEIDNEPQSLIKNGRSETPESFYSVEEQDNQVEIDNEPQPLIEKGRSETPESFYSIEEQDNQPPESSLENLTKLSYAIETQDNNIDALLQIEIASSFPELNGSILDLLDPKIIHEFFNKKKKIEIHYRDNQNAEEHWSFSKSHIIKNTQNNVYKVSYFNKEIYVTIDEKLFNSLEVIHQEAFTRAINNGFVTRSKGQNGIKIIDGKLIELKINQDIRLIAKNIWSNEQKSQLIVFEERKNHQEVQKILSETKIIQIIPLASIDFSTHKYKALLSIDASIHDADYIKPFEKVADNLLMLFNGPTKSGKKDYMLEDAPSSSHKLNYVSLLKSGDCLIDVAKLAHQPTFEHGKKLAVDINLLAGSYYGTNLYSMGLTLSSFIEGNYEQALTSLGYMALPTIATFIGVPSDIYIEAITMHSTYTLADNAISLLSDLSTNEGQEKSMQAYNALYDFMAIHSTEVINYAEQLLNFKLPYLGQTIETESEIV